MSESGANRSPCSNIYAGAGAFSEPEVVGLRNFVERQLPQLKVYMSLHSYGQLFLSPWGYTNEKPYNYADQVPTHKYSILTKTTQNFQKMAAKSAVNAIKNTTGAEYNYGTIAELMCELLLLLLLRSMM